MKRQTLIAAIIVAAFTVFFCVGLYKAACSASPEELEAWVDRANMAASGIKEKRIAGHLYLEDSKKALTHAAHCHCFYRGGVER